MPINDAERFTEGWLVEGEQAFDVQGSAPDARQLEPDPCWLPL
jgi:hypothetical protein